MTRVSVFTPSHDTRYLHEAYAGLAAQTHEDWEWVVLLNGKARTWTPPVEDPRVTVVSAPHSTKGVGALKRVAVEHTKGDVLVELDHDDVLLPTCLTDVATAFAEHPKASLVYSDFAQIEADGSPNTDHFNPDSGWIYTPEEHGGVTYDRCHALAPTPHNAAYIWFEPNHVRAFSRAAYDAVGGYDAAHTILDDQDLMVRLYLHGPFHHIDKLLYLQRVHRKNTQSDPTTNATIQSKTVELYQQWIQPLTVTWARRQGLRTIRLIPQAWYGPPEEEGFEDVRLDVTDPRIDLAAESCGAVLATDVLQKVYDRATFLNECYRVLSHAGLLLTLTPSTDGRGAFQDPGAVAFYNENSFMYLTQEVLRPTLPGLVSRFQVSHLRTFYPSATHEQMQIPYVQANLLAIRQGGPRQGGTLLT